MKTLLEEKADGITPWALAAKNIKRELSDAFPGVKFSVKSDAYSMGDSVSIHWEMGPTTKEVHAISDKYVTSSFDGMQDLKTTFSTPFTDKYGGSDHVMPSRRYPDALWEQVGKDLCALQHIEYNGNWTRGLLGEMDTFDLWSHCHQLLGRTSFKPGEEYAGVEHHSGGESWEWCRIVKKGGTAKPAELPGNQSAEIVKTKHTQKGYDLFVVRLGQRVSRAAFSSFLDDAKSLGGWWSSYDKDGAIPGFQFKTELKALAFLHVLGGKPTLAEAQAGDQKDAEAVKAAATAECAKEKAVRLRELAEGLTAQIEDKRRPMTQNPTPKRNRECRSRLHDSDNLERVQQALIALADAHEAGTVPPELAGIKSKAR